MRPLAWLALLAAPAPARSAEELHDIALLDGARVGVQHTSVVKDDTDGKQLRVTATLDLTLRRFGSPVKLRMEHGTVESADGKVLGVFLKQQHGGGKQLALTGIVLDEDKLHVKVDNGRLERHVRWRPDVLGPVRQESFLAGKKPKAGDTFTFHRYEPVYNSVLTVRVVAKEPEDVDVLGKKRKLLRVEMTPDELKGVNTSVKPPKAIWWLDDSFAVVRKQTEMDGLGTLLLVRTTKEIALAPSTAPAADIGKRSLVPLDRALTRPYETRSVTYRVTVRDETDAASLFVRDGHQSAQNARGGTFELSVHPVAPDAEGTEKPTAEYVLGNHFIDSDEEQIKTLAKKAVGAEDDRWKKALRIERYVKNHLRTDNTADLTPASQIAKSLRGDCRHHALLTAALCRASGLPSRTAIGLLYVHRGGPCLGFHMWTEVLIGGKWLGLDSTLGKGGVSGAHVKVSQHSWHDVQSLTPLLPVSRLPGRLRVEVLRAE